MLVGDADAQAAFEVTKPPQSIGVLSEQQVAPLLDPGELLRALEASFGALDRGEVQCRPRPQVSVPGRGFSLAMAAWQPGMQICVHGAWINRARRSPRLLSPAARRAAGRPCRRQPVVCRNDGRVRRAPVGCAELTRVDHAAAATLGGVVNDPGRGRAHDSEITVYKAMAIAMEDMVAANLVYDRARHAAGRSPTGKRSAAAARSFPRPAAAITPLSWDCPEIVIQPSSAWGNHAHRAAARRRPAPRSCEGFTKEGDDLRFTSDA